MARRSKIGSIEAEAAKRRLAAGLTRSRDVVASYRARLLLLRTSIERLKLQPAPLRPRRS